MSEAGVVLKTLRVTVDVPPSVNNAYYNGAKRGRFLTERASRFKDAAMAEIMAAALAQQFSCKSSDRFGLSLDVYFENDRRRDVSNTAKLAEDSLAQALGFDDCTVDLLTVRRAGIDPDNPRCEITLTILETADEQAATHVESRTPKGANQAPPQWGRISCADYRRLARR